MKRKSPIRCADGVELVNRWAKSHRPELHMAVGGEQFETSEANNAMMGRNAAYHRHDTHEAYDSTGTCRPCERAEHARDGELPHRDAYRATDAERWRGGQVVQRRIRRNPNTGGTQDPGILRLHWPGPQAGHGPHPSACSLSTRTCSLCTGGRRRRPATRRRWELGEHCPSACTSGRAGEPR